MQNSVEEIVLSEKFYRIMTDDTVLTLGSQQDLESLNSDNFVPVLTKDSLNISYFRLKKCSAYISSSLIFLVNCQELLTNFSESLKNYCKNLENFEKKNFKNIKNLENIEKKDHKNIEKFENQKKNLKTLKKCLKNIKLFCLNKLPKLISIEIPNGKIDFHKQNTLKDLKFIQTLTEILDIFSKPNFSEVFSLKIRKILKSIFSLLALICVENKETQQEAFLNIEIYLKYISQDVNANEFLISLFKNNENLLFKISKTGQVQNSAIISAYMRELRLNKSSIKEKERKPQLLNFLITICKCENEALNINQK